MKFYDAMKFDENKLTIFAGPCAIESEEMSIKVANELKKICEELDINFVFKSSFDKANRTSIDGKRGVGINEGLRILHKVGHELQVPLITDVHDTTQIDEVAKVVDILQIPAFLSRQTDLLEKAANTGKIVNVKKGQFMAPTDTNNIVKKFEFFNSDGLLLCERGTSFGYNNLIVDMTGLVEMQTFGVPVVFDATHSVQKPGGNGSSTGGNREMVPYLINAAISVGVKIIFMEVHPDPDNAFSDGPNQIRLENIRGILEDAKAIFETTKTLNIFMEKK